MQDTSQDIIVQGREVFQRVYHWNNEVVVPLDLRQHLKNKRKEEEINATSCLKHELCLVQKHRATCFNNKPALSLYTEIRKINHETDMKDTEGTDMQSMHLIFCVIRQVSFTPISIFYRFFHKQVVLIRC